MNTRAPALKALRGSVSDCPGRSHESGLWQACTEKRRRSHSQSTTDLIPGPYLGTPGMRTLIALCGGVLEAKREMSLPFHPEVSLRRSWSLVAELPGNRVDFSGNLPCYASAIPEWEILTMRKDIEFKSADGVTLRGWHYLPETRSGKVPTIIMAHGLRRRAYVAGFAHGSELAARWFTQHLNPS